MLSYNETLLTLTINSQTALIDGAEKELDTAPIVLSGRTFLPIRFIMECFGYSVVWNETDRTVTIRKEKKEETKNLVVYFSMPETTEPGNMTQEEENSTVIVDGEVLGNTQYVAYVIQENTGADILRIMPKVPYVTNHSDLIDQAKKEQNQKARPELLNNVINIETYDTIFIGYPNWWGDLPMIIYTFLETHDLLGKTVIPFNTHGGSGFSDTINTIKVLQPNAAVVEDGFTVSRNSVHNAENDIIKWLEGLGFQKNR